MYSARHFGINKADGLIKTFMSNDWMHGVLVKEPSDDKIKVLASLIIGSEICLSAGSLIYYQANNNSACTMFSVYTLLYSVLCLSNATKNQKDVFSRHMQSYCHKFWMALSVFTFAMSQGQPMFYALGAVIALDAVLGGTILRQVFDDQKVDFENESSEQVFAPLSGEETTTKKFNNRLPNIVMDNEMG